MRASAVAHDAGLLEPREQFQHVVRVQFLCHFDGYGDPICFDGYLRGIENLFKMVTPGGTLYLSTPIGPERIEFNAHRVFSVAGMSKILKNFGEIRLFSYVDDHGDLHQEVSHSSEQACRSFGCSFGCGIWECVKR